MPGANHQAAALVSPPVVIALLAMFVGGALVVEQAAPPAAKTSASTTQPATALASNLIGGPHDFTGRGRVGRDLCTPCHTPHLVDPPTAALDARSPGARPPLRPYQGLDLTLDEWSLMCLGCHDGVSATDVFSSAHAVGATDQRALGANQPRGLRGHPVGIRYPGAGVDGYRSGAWVEGVGLPLPDGRIQCITCHDPHNEQGHVGLLQISNERSQMCVACHEI